jgi:phage protein U
MAEVMMMLGQFQFGIDTAAYQELSRTTEYRWPSLDVFGGAQALQFTGRGPESINLQGSIFPGWRGGTGQLDAMRGQAAAGEPLMLVTGTGALLGRYVIERVDEKQSVFAAAGVARKQEFTLQLKRYGDAEADPFAPVHLLPGDLVVATLGLPDPGSLARGAAGAMGQAMNGLTGALSAVQGMVGAVAAPLQGALGVVRQGISAARTIQAAAKDAQGVIGSLGSITTLDGAERALGGLVRVTSTAVNGASAGSRIITDVVGRMGQLGDPLPAIATLQNTGLAINRLAVAATGISRQASSIIQGFRL